MISGTNLVSNAKSEYTYNGLLARVKKTSGAQASSYMPNYAGGIHNDLVTQIAGVGTVNAVYGQGYGRVSQRFMPETATGAADTYFQHDLYGSTLFAADAQGAIRHHAVHDIWGMPETACGDSSVASGLRFTMYDYDDVLGKHFAHARMYDPSQGRMLGADPVKRGLNGYAYCDNDPVNQTDPTGEVANILLGGIAGGIIGGAFGFAGSALSQIAAGNGFSARKAWGAAANGAIVGAARGALVGSGAGIPLAFGVDFAAGMAGSLAEQKIAGGRLSPVRAAVDGAFNAAGGRLYGTSPLRNAKDAFMRGALEGALKGGAYNIADVLDNKLRNAYGSGGRRNPGTTGIRNPWNKKNQTPWNSRNPRPTGSRCPQSDCIRPKPLKGMRNPKRRGGNSSRNTTHRNDRFSLGSFVRDVVSGAVMGGLASVAFYGAGKAVEALKRNVMETHFRNNNLRGIKERRLDEVITNNPPLRGDVIKINNIYKELRKSEVGRQTLEYLVNNDDISVDLYYFRNPNIDGLLGRIMGNHIEIFVSSHPVKTKINVTKTLIHEVTHASLNSLEPTRKEEVICFVREYLHDNGTIDASELRKIVREVNNLYDNLPWR